MKILRIELQNINSLKSETPIVIDFENENFKDVGLYAITGSTGAGKTTILDAITIALYHSVPRFNGTKGTLLDVVSYGATEAFSRVTFENENVRYEAYWGVNLVSKTGKVRLKPLEIVSLKNLTTNVILSDQKRALATEVIKVTQLDYDQFLRSVMLAQGEFASFLSAKGPEKGRLLEQITGEEIYKKIGQGILDRKSNEEGKLRELQSRINSDDVISEDRKIELKQKDKELDVQIGTSDKEVAAIQVIANWYVKSLETHQQNEKLEQDVKDLDSAIENHKTEFQLLDLNEKAEPFAVLIQNFNRNEKSTLQRLDQLKTIEDQLASLKPRIEKVSALSKNQLLELEKADKDFAAWLPKFDLITKVDAELKNEIENAKNAKEKLDTLNRQMQALQEEKSKLSKLLKETGETIKSEEGFLVKNDFLTEVDTQISNWTTKLTTLKGNKEILLKDSNFITDKKTSIVETNAKLAGNKILLTNASVEIEKIEKQIKALNELLTKNNLSDLLRKQKSCLSAEAHWKQFSVLVEEVTKEEKEQAKAVAQKKDFSNKIELVKIELERLEKQIITQELSVADAEKILDLERSISKYEDDRQKLISGQACALCGSKEHPFTEGLECVGVSKSEKELKERRGQLKIALDAKAELDKKEVKLRTSIDSLTQQIKTITEELKVIIEKSKKIGIEFNLNNICRVDDELKLVFEDLQALDKKIHSVQELQSQKDTLTEAYNGQRHAVELLKRTDATLKEKIKNTLAEIDSKQKTITNLSQNCTDLENDLKIKLSQYNYEVPSVDKTKIFIETVQKEIVKYNKMQKDLAVLKADTKVLEGKLNHIDQQLATDAKIQTDYTKIISDSAALSSQLKSERVSILPIEITVENKRRSLIALIKQLTETSERSRKELQSLLDAQREKEAVRVVNIKEQETLKVELVTLQSSLDALLEKTDFATKEDVEKALLSSEDKQKYTQLKDRIKEQELKLKTLKETNLKTIEELNKKKDFAISEAESKVALEELGNKRDALSAEKGEIKEAFRKDEEIKDRNKEVYKKIVAQESICNVWRELFKVLGGSKDAFNVYVQRLTLKHLLDLANVHLYKLNKRYSLKMEEDYKPKEELNFNLIDHYQTNQARLVDTSSGGEKFIISLSLALGLSDLASKNVKIDSLFIDEGFGTLDNNTLETVISTLETLQSQGKMIGIISHVENLKERIPTQIQITKKSNGVSVVDIL